MEKKEQIFLKSADRSEVVEVIRFLSELSADEQKEMLCFLRCVGQAGMPERKICPEAVTMA